MNEKVKPKKALGQHFLTHQPTAQRIVDLLEATGSGPVLEIGPGMGILTRPLLERFGERLWVVEIDRESVAWLLREFPQLEPRILQGDFLKMDLGSHFDQPLSIIGNFPYNISSQILFHILDYPDLVTEVVGMFQREVGRRLVSPPGSREYGILSVLMGAFYLRRYHFTVSEQLFRPPPRVKSGVVSFVRNHENETVPDPKGFFRLVKMAFNQRRKTLRNALSSCWNEKAEATGLGGLRAEQLHYTDFLIITRSTTG